MRDIKFRAWNTFHKEMYFFKVGEGYNGLMIDRESIMQFTGLHDKNGKEIYEGDIVSASIYSDEKPKTLEVYYDNGCFIIEYQDSESDFTPLGWFPSIVEIIGNIYENPEHITPKS